MNDRRLNDDLMGQPPYDPGVEEERGRWGCMKTCLVVAVGVGTVCVIGCIGGAWYLYNNGLRMAAPMARRAAEQALQDVELPAEEKTAILEQVDRLAVAAEEKRITLVDLQVAMQGFAESPLFAAWMVFAADAKYVQPSGLSPEEKEDGVRVLQRVLRGLYEKQLDLTDLEPLRSHILVRDADGNETLKESLTDDELREFLLAGREKVDGAGVPDEPFEIQISTEMRKVVDQVLGENTGPAESDSPDVDAEIDAEIDAESSNDRQPPDTEVDLPGGIPDDAIQEPLAVP